MMKAREDVPGGKQGCYLKEVLVLFWRLPSLSCLRRERHRHLNLPHRPPQGQSRTRHQTRSLVLAARIGELYR